MALRINNALRSAIVDGIVGSFGTAKLWIFTSPQPGTAGATSGTCACLVEIDNIDWNAANTGTAALKTAYTGTSGTSGTAFWARLADRATGTSFIIDGGCGVSSTNSFVIDSESIIKDGVVQLNTAYIVQPAE